MAAAPCRVPVALAAPAGTCVIDGVANAALLCCVTLCDTPVPPSVTRAPSMTCRPRPLFTHVHRKPVIRVPCCVMNTTQNIMLCAPALYFVHAPMNVYTCKCMCTCAHTHDTHRPLLHVMHTHRPLGSGRGRRNAGTVSEDGLAVRLRNCAVC